MASYEGSPIWAYNGETTDERGARVYVDREEDSTGVKLTIGEFHSDGTHAVATAFLSGAQVARLVLQLGAAGEPI